MRQPVAEVARPQDERRVEERLVPFVGDGVELFEELLVKSYARRFGYGVVRDFTGHGIGRSFHSGLVIPHYDAAPSYDTVIEPGMTFTIEPMLNLGTEAWEMWDDDWTVVTADRRRSAQFEHTILITDTGNEILTLP